MRWRRILLRSAVWVVVIYALFAGAAYLRTPSVMYRPPPPTYPADDPTLVRLPAGDGAVVARMTTVASPRATVLFAHGNAGDLGTGVDVVRRFTDLGVDVLAFDYRGYGRSSGEPSEDGTYEDIDATYRYLVDEREVEPRSIVVVGLSMGGGPSAWLAQHRKIGGLLLWSTMASANATVGGIADILPIDYYETVDRLPDIDVPVAILHGDADDVIGVDNAHDNLAAANEPKRFVIVPGAGHGDVPELEHPVDDLLEWLVDQLR
jgi:pimeloyl-ACP methyl ester carboxylesterase